MNLLFTIPQEHRDEELAKASSRISSLSSPIRRRPAAYRALQGRPMPEDGRVIEL
jgi:hypothetical protein